MTQGFDIDELAFGNAMIEATPAILTEIRELRAENARLREDLRRAESEEVVAHCEGCSAPLLSKDDFIADDDCVSGCWASMSDRPSIKDRPCYAYRVGKPDARAALKGPSHDA